MTKSVIGMTVLAVPFLLIVSSADAQTSKKARDARAQAVPRELSDEAIAARAKCGQLALARPQSADEFRASPGPRYVIYTSCMKETGFRP